MPTTEAKPSTFTVAALAAGGLLLAAFSRGGASVRQPATRPPESAASRRRAEREVAAPDAGERGRTADTPTQIPARGWWDILKRTLSQVSDDRVLTEAAGITFYALLALFPAIAALVSIYGLFADPATIQDHLNSLSGVLPSGALEIIGEQVKRISSQGGGALGFAFFFGLAISLWSANAGMKAVLDALNVAYGEEEKRSFVQLNLRSLAFTLGIIVFIVVAIGAIVIIPIVLNLVGLGSAAEWIISLARWPVLLASIMLLLAALYRYGPSRESAQWRWISAGSIVAAVIWVIASMLFSWYVASFGSYNETYGSLGAVIGLLTWMWLSTIIVLVGAELNAEIEHQTVQDTTEHRGMPLGARGARMADSVGEAEA